MSAVESAAGDPSVRSAAATPSRSGCEFVVLIETRGDLPAVEGVPRHSFGVTVARFIGVLVIAMALRSRWDPVLAIPASGPTGASSRS